MRIRSIAIALLVFAAASTARAAPTSQPAARRDQLKHWLTQLADPDDAVRSAARAELMGIKRPELEEFRQVVEASRPLRPSQASVLREIIIQVYLAGEDYDRAMDAPFLGIRMVQTVLNTAGDGEAVTGVVVAGRVPGFVGYRMFMDGDVILRLLEPRTVSIRAPEELSELVTAQRVGRRVAFEVLRHGQIIRVSLRLDAKPAQWLQIEEFQLPRQEKAQDYWNRAFAPLLNEKVS